MKDKDFDKIILKGLQDPQFSPQWERMQKVLDEATASEESSFDNLVKSALGSLGASEQSSWDRMSTLLEGHVSDQSDAPQEHPLTEEDQIIAEKLIQLHPKAQPKWSSFSSVLDDHLPENRTLHLFDRFVQRALSGLIVTENPDWSRMNFILAGDQLLGHPDAFDGQIKNAIDNAQYEGDLPSGWERLKTSLDLEEKRRKGIYRWKAMEAAVFLLLALAIPGMLYFSSSSLGDMPISVDDHETKIETNTSNEIQIANPTQSINKELGQVEATQQRENEAIQRPTSEMKIPHYSENESVVQSDEGVNEILITKKTPPIEEDIKSILPVLKNEDSETDHLVVSDFGQDEFVGSNNILIDRLNLSGALLGTIDDKVIGLELEENSPRKHKDASLVGKLLWHPYVAAYTGMDLFEMQVRTLDNEKKTMYPMVKGYEYGVRGGWSNGMLDVETGISKMDIHYDEDHGDEMFYENNDKDSVFQVTLTRSIIKTTKVPLNFRVHLPIENTNLNLLFRVGLNGTMVKEAPSLVAVDHLKDNEDLPIGGRRYDRPPSSNDPQEIKNRIRYEATDFWLDGNVGLGFEYTINPKFSVLLEGKALIPLGDRNIGSIADSYESAYGLGVGLQYHFR